MTTATEADFARMHGVSREAVRKWKARGYISLSGNLVRVEASDARLLDAGKGRFARKRQASTEPVNTAPEVTLVDDASTETVPGPSGVHPLASYATAAAESAACHVAELLLPLLPADQVRQIAEDVLARQHRGAIECLEADRIEPPAGLPRWSEWEGLARPVVNGAEWQELVAEFGSTPAHPRPKRRPRAAS